jgi:hypothetical protein
MKQAATAVLLAIAPSAAPTPIETIYQSSYLLAVEAVGNSEDDNGRRLTIYRDGKRHTVVSLEGGLATVRESLPSALSAKNKIHSKFVFASPSMPDGMIVVFGPAFASDPGALRVMKLSDKANPDQLFSDETFALTDVRRGANGSLLMIGKRSFSQMSARCLTTYDPYSVFELDTASDRFRYSLPMSRRYNLSHYAGWAGRDAREDIGVNICKKPSRIVRLSPRN